MIREITEKYEIKESVLVIRESFQTGALEFNLTKDNCPTNAAFIEYDVLVRLKDGGAKFFGYFIENKQTGFAAIKKATNEIYYVEKLAVIPGLRHKGYGTELMNFAENYVRKCKGKKVSVGIIDDNVKLKNWYGKLGYKVAGFREFNHLPFKVCFMNKDVI
jgi:ribosomal protein S18 acetylase RimI-like enzyme